MCDIQTDTLTPLVWHAVTDGLGSLLMEELVPGSAPINELAGASAVLTRAVQKPHRRRILAEMFHVLARRRDDLIRLWHPVNVQQVTNFAEYESLAVATWAAMTANITTAIDYMPELILRGWALAERSTTFDDPYGQFCFILVTAAGDPKALELRDYWSFKAFEPIAAAGGHFARRSGIDLKEIKS
jgi:hypothetical protein